MGGEERKEKKAKKEKRSKEEKKAKKEKRAKKERKRAREEEDGEGASPERGGAGEARAGKHAKHGGGESGQGGGGQGGGVRKDFYEVPPSVKGRPASEVAAWRSKHATRVTLVEGGAAAPAEFVPFLDFRDLSFLSSRVTACTRGFQEPTVIQAEAWPLALRGRDVIGIAKTGSGKTLAFTLPALVHCLDQAPPHPRASVSQGGRQQVTPIVLCLSPTRELALQIAAVAKDAGAKCGVRSVCVYGGMPKHEQRKELYGSSGSGAGPRGDPLHMLIATPGRLMDLMEEGTVALDRVTYLVLDEADRMLDQGFEKEMRRVMAATHQARQTLLFSATWPLAIQELANDFLDRPVKVNVGSEDLAANHAVSQKVEVLEEREKERRLEGLLKTYHASRENRVILFVLYKKEALRVEETLQRRGWNCVGIHGDKSQEARLSALSAFKSGRVPLLIATDVAARGLDIPDVEVVINYSFPLTTEDYVHRIGRTGRAGKLGVSHTLFTPNDKGRAGELINVLREAGQDVPDSLLKFGTTVKKKEHKLYGNVDMDKIGDVNKRVKITFENDSD